MGPVSILPGPWSIWRSARTGCTGCDLNRINNWRQAIAFHHLLLVMLILVLPGGMAWAQGQRVPVKSPDGKLEAEFWINDAGSPRYQVRQGGNMVLQESRLG